MYNRSYNFSAGPATMPVPVLEEIRDEMMNYRGTGMCVMEMSHRSKAFQEIYDNAEADLRKLMGIPDNYKVLFIQGGATLQFSMIPLNLMKNGVADYIVTGAWSKKAFSEAKKYGDETIHGTTYQQLPNTKGKILVSDQSSMFLSKPCNVSDYGVIYGGVQKNIGPAGLAIVIIREDLIREDLDPKTPVYLRYDTHAGAGSMYNTPNCWAIYVCGKVFRYLLDNGGLEAIQKVNEDKAAVLYDYLDNSQLFNGTVDKEVRSLMNVPFVTGSKELDAEVVAYTKAAGFDNLKGHKSVGGLRASIYNAMPKEGVVALVECLKQFEAERK